MRPDLGRLWRGSRARLYLAAAALRGAPASAISAPGMTEAEASDRWCPWGRRDSAHVWATTGDPAFNSVQIVGGVEKRRGMCIASRCMAWRQTSERRGFAALHEEQRLLPPRFRRSRGEQTRRSERILIHSK